MLTSGSFEFEERVTTGDYQHKAARAIVQFDDPHDISLARDLAMQQVRTSLGIIIPVQVAKPTTDASEAIGRTGGANPPTGAKKALAEPPLTQDEVMQWPAPKKPKTLPQIVTEVKAELDANPRKPGDIYFPHSDEIPGPKFFTDAELIAACRAKQAAGIDGTIIRQLIMNYGGKSIATLDRNNDAREKFMTALNAL